MCIFLPSKTWCNISEAIKLIHNETNQKLNKQFLYKLAMSNDITLSLNIPNNVYTGHILHKHRLPDPYNYLLFEAKFISDSKYKICHGELFRYVNQQTCNEISGIWDIAQNYDTEKYDFLIALDEAESDSIKTIKINHIDLISSDKETYARALYQKGKTSNSPLSWSLKKSNRNKVEIGFRVENLNKYIQMLSQNNSSTSQKKTKNLIKTELSTKEQNSILSILAVFLECNHEMGDIRDTQKYPLAEIIKTLGTQYGIDIPSDNTIVKFLEEAKALIPIKNRK